LAEQFILRLFRYENERSFAPVHAAAKRDKVFNQPLRQQVRDQSGYIASRDFLDFARKVGAGSGGDHLDLISMSAYHAYATQLVSQFTERFVALVRQAYNPQWRLAVEFKWNRIQH